MSEHEHGYHEPWKAKLSQAFKGLKEADDDRDARKRHNEEAVRRIIEEVFPPVFTQFIKDAKENGVEAEVTQPQQPNNRQQLKLKGPTTCQIDFSTEATPDAAAVYGCRVGTGRVNFLSGKKPEQFHQADLGEFLATQLNEIRPNKK